MSSITRIVRSASARRRSTAPADSRLALVATASAAPRALGGAAAAEHLESLERGMRVLELFAAGSPAQLTMIEVAEALDMPRAVARRVLFTLTRLGYLRDDDGTYSLAPRMLRLGYAYLATLGFRALAQPILADLSAATGHTCSVGVLDGTDVAYVARTEAKRLVRLDLSIGSRIPAWCNSMGRVLLGGLDDAALDRYLAALKPQRFTPHTVIDRARLRARIVEARAAGWCYIADEVEEGICGIAAPLRDAAGRIVAATNMSLAFHPHSRRDVREKLAPALIAATRRIEDILQSGVAPA